VLKEIAPWIAWMVLLATLAIVGSGRRGPTPASNPRSLTVVTANTTEKPQSKATTDCNGNTLAQTGVAK